MSFHLALPWHDGEIAVHSRISSTENDNPTIPALSPAAAASLQTHPLIAVGTLDPGDNRPWTSLWGGHGGLGQALGGGMIGLRVAVDSEYDPVASIMMRESRERGGEVVEVRKENGGRGRIWSALTTSLETRRRQKMAGRMLAGALKAPKNEEEGVGTAQLIIKVEQSLGNCPKYLNCKTISPADPPSHPRLVSDSSTLGDAALALIDKADLFYVSSSFRDEDMDTNHRGGPPGFVRVSQKDGVDQIIWPEYSGNRLYQTLGNLEATPRAGLVFPDFATGDALYVTGDTEILIGQDAEAVMPHSNLAVRLTVVRAKYVAQSLTFRGEAGAPSPYNPRVRPLASEAHLDVGLAGGSSELGHAKLESIESLTPSISRLRFSMSPPAPAWHAGAWVAFSFADELDMGYSHMRDDDPSSLNDDFVRTFTVSSPLPPDKGDHISEFEVTIRRVGPVTKYMFTLDARSEAVPVLSFGGGMDITQEQGSVTPFVAGGVGITPLLAVFPSLDASRLKLFWTVHADDVGLVTDTLERNPSFADFAELYVTGDAALAEAACELLRNTGLAAEKCHARRLQKEDLLSLHTNDAGVSLGNKWYACVSGRLAPTITGWLSAEGKEVVYESFNF